MKFRQVGRGGLRLTSKFSNQVGICFYFILCAVYFFYLGTYNIASCGETFDSTATSSRIASKYTKNSGTRMLFLYTAPANLVPCTFRTGKISLYRKFLPAYSVCIISYDNSISFVEHFICRDVIARINRESRVKGEASLQEAR